MQIIYLFALTNPSSFLFLFTGQALNFCWIWWGKRLRQYLKNQFTILQHWLFFLSWNHVF